MAKKIGNRTVQIIRKTKVDRLSTAAAPDDETHDIEGCAVLPRMMSGAQSSRETDKGWVIIEGRMIIAPYGADVLSGDLVSVDGKTWQVDGEPGNFENRRGVGKCCIFYLDRLGTPDGR